MNLYSIRIGNATTVIEVEGVHYGAGAWTKVLRANEADSEYYGLPINALLAERAPISRKRAKKEIGQLAQIHEDAARILLNATDVLAGDFSALDALVERKRQIDEERLARAPSPEQKAAHIAFSEAGHAFKADDFKKVVDLLSPHIELLNNAQQKKYQIALTRLNDA